jgi:glutamyl-tRNA reductase
MTSLCCVSLGGCRAPLELLEATAFGRDELVERLPGLFAASGADGIAVLSTCQRTEVYASWTGTPDPSALIAALAADRNLPRAVVESAASVYVGEAAARHLFRVATGLESFVLGETEIAGQVRAANEASRRAGVADAAVQRLLGSAIATSRHAHRSVSVAATSRSVASVAIDRLLADGADALRGRQVLVVGAGQVAGVVVDRATRAGAVVTVCNRSRRHADRFTAAGARVVDLVELTAHLAVADVAILATAAPHPLVDADLLRAARPGDRSALTLVDLALPRNVDPSVRALASARLIDLADLRAGGAGEAAALSQDVVAIEAIIETELARYQRWVTGQTVAAALHRMRGDAERIALQEVARAANRFPPELVPALERALVTTAHRLVHGPTQELLLAAGSGDAQLADVLGRLYASGTDQAGPRKLLADDTDAAVRRRGTALDGKRAQVRAREHALHQRGVHAAHELAV